MHFRPWKRREFITLLGGAVAWPLAARAQQAERGRRVGVLMAVNPDEQGKARVAALTNRLRELGWVEGRNIRYDVRWLGSETARARAYAAELVRLSPDLLVANGPTVLDLQRETSTIPIVFVQVPAPVELGVVASLARPGGMTTGFTHFEFDIAGKWLELLKEISPRTRRVAFLVLPEHPATPGFLRTADRVAAALGLTVFPIGIHDVPEIERGISGFAGEPDSALMIAPSTPGTAHRKSIIAGAAHYGLPAIYCYRYYVKDGGLISYGPDDETAQYSRAAAYVDRILKGEKPGELPVQAPTKYELVINLKTAKALGLEVPPTLLARADEVIE
jgi:putative tryptophan/tyrosine transport system substrate-binding protein